MRQVKAYVELNPYEEVAAAAGADRVVSSYRVTQTASALAVRLLADLAAPRPVTNDSGVAALQVIAGQRGVGKSHLMAFLRALIAQRPLRALVTDSAILHALGQMADRAPFAIDLNFAGHEQEPFEQRLRQAICEALGGALAFTDEQWAHAVAHEQVFEQTLHALPLTAQLILFVDHLPRRWEVAPEQTKDDLDWLALIARQSSALPLRAVIARDEDAPADGVTGTIYHLPANHLKEVVTRQIFKKTPQQTAALGEIYRELSANLAGFAWPEDEFAACYPLHPLIFDLAPVLRACTPKFSLPAFASAAAARVLNHPAISPVVLDELFDRYEYEMRKNAALAPAFTVYDRIIADGVMRLPVMERLWAKLVAKAVLLLALGEREITPRAVAEAQLLCEPGAVEAGLERIANILGHFAESCPDAFRTEPGRSSYTLTPPRPAAKAEEEVERAAESLSVTEPQTASRLSELLVEVGGRFFPDWESDAGGDGAVPFSRPREILWRGSARHVEVTKPAARRESESSQSGPHVEAASWQVELVPCNFDAQGADSIPSGNPAFTIQWQPGAVTDEAALRPLKMLLAMSMQSSDAEGPGPSAAHAALRERLCEQVRALFVELYLTRGTLVESLSGQRRVRPIAAEASEQGATLSTFLTKELSRVFADVFPAHPDFSAPLDDEQTAQLVVGLFAQTSNAVHDGRLQELAARYALPLGLVSRAPGEGGATAYRLDIFHGTNTPHPLIQALLNFIDGHAEQSGFAAVALKEVRRFLAAPPYGLTPPLAHLVVGALTASGLVELVNEESGETLQAGNLHLGFEPGRFAALRRVTSADYPQEVLAEWGRRLTGDGSLPPPINRETDERIRAALKSWLAEWDPESLAARFEHLPIEMQTVGHWRAVHASRQRFARVFALADAAARGQLPLSTALSRAADVFGFDLDLLAQTQAEMRALDGFLNWVPTLTGIRNYVLAAEPTAEPEIELQRQELTAEIYASHRLIDPARRAEVEERFHEFRRRYSDFYAAAHESHVGASASRELIASFCEGEEWKQFSLLLHLRLDDGAFQRDTQALLGLAAETRCELPVRELLHTQPHCCCAFRLHRRLHLGSLLDALKAVANAALTYYSLTLWRRREELRTQVARLDDARLINEVEAFLAGCGNGDLSRITPELVQMLNRCLSEPPAETDTVRFVLNAALLNDSLRRPF